METHVRRSPRGIDNVDYALLVTGRIVPDAMTARAIPLRRPDHDETVPAEVTSAGEATTAEPTVAFRWLIPGIAAACVALAIAAVALTLV